MSSDNSAVVTLATPDTQGTKVESKRYSWNSTDATWLASSFQDQGAPAGLLEDGWSAAGAASGNKIHIVRNLSMATNTLGSTAWTTTPFDTETNGANSGLRQHVITVGARVWVLYVTHVVAGQYSLRLAWSSDLGGTWSRATLANNADPRNLGGQLVPWSKQYTYMSGTQTVTRSTEVAALYRSGQSWFTLRSFVPADGAGFQETLKATTGQYSLPSAIGWGTAGVRAVYDDGSTGATYITYQDGGSWTTESLGIGGDNSCPNEPSVNQDASTVSISQVDGTPVIAYTAGGSVSYLVRSGTNWSTMPPLDPPDFNSSVGTAVGRPHLASSGYGGRIPIEYIAEYPNGILKLIFDTVSLPQVPAVISKSTEIISPNGDGLYDQITLSLIPSRPVISTLKVIYPNNSFDTRSCSTTYSTTVSCQWSGVPAGASADGTYTAQITTTASDGTAPLTSSTTFKVDLTPPSGGTFSLHSESSLSMAFATPTTLRIGGASAFDAIAGVSQVQYSNDPATLWTQVPYCNPCATDPWVPASGPDGPRTVYARFIDTVGNKSATITDTIAIETGPPTGTMTASPAVSSSTAISLALTASDPAGITAASGVHEVRFGCGGSVPTGAWQAFASSSICTVPAGEGQRTISYHVRDVAGNLSQIITSTITIDTVAPTVTLIVPMTTNHKMVPVRWSAVDAGSGVASYDVEGRQGTGSWMALLTNTQDTSVQYQGAWGQVSEIRVRARDAIGNLSGWVSATSNVQLPVVSAENLGKGDLGCDALKVEAGSELCQTALQLLEDLGTLIQDPPPLGSPKIALLSSGIQCSVFPPDLRTRIAGCTDNPGAVSDVEGYGTWATSVVLQKLPGAYIESFPVFAGGKASDGLVAGALDKVLERIDSGLQFDLVLFVFSPADILDPTSYLMNRTATVPLAKQNLLGSEWDIAMEAVAAHPYTTEAGNTIMGIPLNDGLRAAFLAEAEPRQAAAVNTLVGKAKIWSRIRGAIQDLNARDVPSLIGTGDMRDAPTQSIVGIAALPEVITVGPSVVDGQGVDRLSPLAARGPAPDLSLKPDLLALSDVPGILPLTAKLAALGDSTIGPRWPGTGDAPTVGTLAPWSISASAIAAVNVALVIDRLGAGTSTDVIRGVLSTLASKHKAKKPEGSQSAAAWEQGAGVLRPTELGELGIDDVIPTAIELATLPVPLGRFDLGDVAVGGSKSKEVGFWQAGATPSLSIATGSRFLGPGDGGFAVESTHAGQTGVSVSMSGSTAILSAGSGVGGADRYQGGTYCVSIQSSVYSWPACLIRDSRIVVQSDFLRVGGERTESETIALTPGMPVDVRPLGPAYKFIPLDPMMVPIGVEITDSNGQATFDDVPPGFWRTVHFASYDAAGTYSDLDDPTKTIAPGTAEFKLDTWIYSEGSTLDVGWEAKEQVREQPASEFHPPATFGHAMAFDSERNKLVVFGGRTEQGTLSAETWEYTDSTIAAIAPVWAQASPVVSPPGRSGAVMAFDQVREKIVMFGGKDAAGNYLDDTWLYDGLTWTQVSPLGLLPDRRADAAMVWNGASSKVMMAGGQTTPDAGQAKKALSSVWEWDGMLWTPRPSLPSTRIRPGLAYDSSTQTVLVYGGEVTNWGQTGLQEFNGLTWSTPAVNASATGLPQGPSSLVYDPSRNLTVLTVYFRGAFETWELSRAGTVRNWLKDVGNVGQPPSRIDGELAYVGNSRVVLFGGLAPKMRTLGLRPGNISFSFLFPARTRCIDATSPIGPLGVPGETQPYLNDVDHNPNKCLDRTKLSAQWTSQLRTSAQTTADGLLGCQLVLPGVRPSELNVYCEQVTFAVPLSVNSRYVDLVKASDFDMCGTGVAGNVVAIDALLRQGAPAMCEGPPEEPDPTDTAWTYHHAGQGCDPDVAGGSVSADYSFVSADHSNPDLNVGILHYRFSIPSPNFYATANVVFNYDVTNTMIGVFATTGSGTTTGSPSGGLVVTSTPQVRVTPAESIEFLGKRGTATVQAQLWPSGETQGDLYVLLIPTSLVPEGAVGSSATIAHAEICNLSFELDTFARSRSVNVSMPSDVLTRQLAAPSFNPPYPKWWRYGWDPAANQGAGEWRKSHEETETVDWMIHVPKGWNAGLRNNPGTGGRPTELRSTGGQTIIPGCATPQAGATYPVVSKMFDVRQGVTSGIIPLTFIPENIVDELDLNDPASIPLNDPWSVNGRFFGVLHIPDVVVRQVPNITMINSETDGTSAMLPWAGQEPFDCTTSWEKVGRFVGARLVPYPIPPTKGFQVVAGYLIVYANLEELEIGLQPPGGEPVTATVDLSCETSATGVCAG